MGEYLLMYPSILGPQARNLLLMFHVNHSLIGIGFQ